MGGEGRIGGGGGGGRGRVKGEDRWCAWSTKRAARLPTLFIVSGWLSPSTYKKTCRDIWGKTGRHRWGKRNSLK